MLNKITFVILLALCWPIITHAQESTTKQPVTKDSSPITTTGINVSQFITTDINRSTLTFNFDVNHAFNLSANFNKFISDKNKQINLYGSIKTINFQRKLESPKSNYWNALLGVNAKFFDKKNRFFEANFENIAVRPRGADKLIGYSSHKLSLGIGTGRIDYVNDANVAQRLIKKLEKLSILKRAMSEDEMVALTSIIADIKNERKYVNRSYSLFESKQISMYLEQEGIIDEGTVAIDAAIEESFRYEPLIDRTTGTQFRAGLYGIVGQAQNFNTDYFYAQGLSLNASKHEYHSDKLQSNTSASFFIQNSQGSNFPSPKQWLTRGGISINRETHYLINDRSRLSLISTLGVNLDERFTGGENQETEFSRNVFFNNKLEYEFMTSRRTSVTLGLFANWSSHGNATGMSLGIKF